MWRVVSILSICCIFAKSIIQRLVIDVIYMHENYLRRAELVQEITREHYEAGRLDRCHAEVWRRWVYPVYPCCYHTYLSLLRVDVAQERLSMQKAVSKPSQAPSLFPDFSF